MNYCTSYFIFVPIFVIFVSTSVCWSFHQDAPPSALTKLRMVATESAISSLLPVINNIDGGSSSSNTLLSSEELKLKLQNKRVALYFSAGWCPMCTSLEPTILQFRKASEDSDKPIELIYISSDRTETDAQQRATQLGMLSVPFARTAEYKKRFNIWSGPEGIKFGFKGRRSGVPALVVLSKFSFHLISAYIYYCKNLHCAKFDIIITATTARRKGIIIKYVITKSYG